MVINFKTYNDRYEECYKYRSLISANKTVVSTFWLLGGGRICLKGGTVDLMQI